GDKLQDCSRMGIGIDSITFSGDGEPTLNPDFPAMVDITLELRDRFFPQAKVSVLSNATMVHKDAVFEALRKVDNPILKIDAPTTELARRINRPSPGYRVEAIVEALKRFEGDFVMQTMFLRSADFDSSSPEVLDGWMDIVRTLRPREVMVYTIDRETPQEGLVKFTAEEMRELVRPLSEEGFIIQIRG
ncbi:MAG: radical SAM protein, partial [Bacteroidales bacterium]|nr:radical SAM protein [Bacteroidales bacterium]